MTEPTRATVTQADQDLAGEVFWLIHGEKPEKAAALIAQYREDAVRQVAEKIVAMIRAATWVSSPDGFARYIERNFVLPLSATPAVPDPRDEQDEVEHYESCPCCGNFHRMEEQYDAAIDRGRRLEAALKTFADKVFNDNGDVTVHVAVTTDELISAYHAYRAEIAPQPGAGESV